MPAAAAFVGVTGNNNRAYIHWAIQSPQHAARRSLSAGLHSNTIICSLQSAVAYMDLQKIPMNINCFVLK